MPDRNALVEHCLELLAPIAEARARRMFGGHGIRLDGLFVAIIAFDKLYLKADALTRPQFADAGCQPFVYEAKGRSVTLNYWTAPPESMESPEAMRPWARLALQAALRAQGAKRTATTRKAAGRAAGRQTT